MGDRYTDEMIEHIVQLGKDPKNWRPAGPESGLIGRQIASEIADSLTDTDWREYLNTVPLAEAADMISRRPPQDRQRLLDLMNPDSRPEVVRLIAVAV